MSRRLGSATALNASEVVAALAMPPNIFLYGYMSRILFLRIEWWPVRNKSLRAGICHSDREESAVFAVPARHTFVHPAPGTMHLVNQSSGYSCSRNRKRTVKLQPGDGVSFRLVEVERSYGRRIFRAYLDNSHSSSATARSRPLQHRHCVSRPRRCAPLVPRSRTRACRFLRNLVRRGHVLCGGMRLRACHPERPSWFSGNLLLVRRPPPLPLLAPPIRISRHGWLLPGVRRSHRARRGQPPQTVALEPDHRCAHDRGPSAEPRRR